MTQGLCIIVVFSIEYIIIDTVRITADNSRYVDIVVSVTSHHGIGSNLQKINCVSMNYYNLDTM